MCLCVHVHGLKAVHAHRCGRRGTLRGSLLHRGRRLGPGGDTLRAPRGGRLGAQVRTPVLYTSTQASRASIESHILRLLVAPHAPRRRHSATLVGGYRLTHRAVVNVPVPAQPAPAGLVRVRTVLPASGGGRRRAGVGGTLRRTHARCMLRAYPPRRRIWTRHAPEPRGANKTERGSVCVREREREYMCVRVCERVYVCKCVCVCVRVCVCLRALSSVGGRRRRGAFICPRPRRTRRWRRKRRALPPSATHTRTRPTSLMPTTHASPPSSSNGQSVLAHLRSLFVYVSSPRVRAWPSLHSMPTALSVPQAGRGALTWSAAPAG
jgi:hypothetical protein